MTKPGRVRADLTSFSPKASVACALLALAPACGSGNGKTTVDPDAPDPEPTFTLEEIAAQRAAEERCRRAWQPLLGHVNVEASAPRRIAASGDTIVYGVGMGTVEESLIRALPTSEPGPPVTLLNDWYSNLWVEDSRLFYTPYTPRLMSVPMAGGTPQLEVEAAPPLVGAVMGSELTSEHLYWLEVEQSTGDWRSDLRRVPRRGGEPELVAELEGPFFELQEAEGGGMIAWSTATGALIESDGTVRILQERVTGVSVLGADAGAVYIYNNGLLLDGTMWRVPANGSEPEPFLPEEQLAVLHVWSDGAGGWLAHGMELGASDELLGRLWSISPEGDAQLLACDPLVDGALELSNPIFTSDAIYFAAQYSDMWQLVRVERQPAAQ